MFSNKEGSGKLLMSICMKEKIMKIRGNGKKRLITCHTNNYKTYKIRFLPPYETQKKRWAFNPSQHQT